MNAFFGESIEWSSFEDTVMASAEPPGSSWAAVALTSRSQMACSVSISTVSACG